MLADLSTYSLQDFLLFDAAIYRDLFAQINARAWPLAVVGGLVALLCLVLAAERHRLAAPASLTLLAAAFATSAWLFFFGVYATINWAAIYPGWAFVAEAGLLLATAIALARVSPPQRSYPPRPLIPGGVLVLYGLIGHPLAGWLFGPAPDGLEWFGLAPDPTAIVAVGLLAASVPRRRLTLPLAALPLLWLLLSAATLWLLEASGEALPLLTVAAIGLAVLLAPAYRPRFNVGDRPLPVIAPPDEAVASRSVAATLVPSSPLDSRTRRS